MKIQTAELANSTLVQQVFSCISIFYIELMSPIQGQYHKLELI